GLSTSSHSAICSVARCIITISNTLSNEINNCFKMKYFILRGRNFILLSFVYILILFDMTMSTCEDRCQRQEFRIMPGTSANGEVLLYDGPWPWKTCRRLCRQYVECLAFKMTWSTPEHNLGLCTIYKGFIKQSHLERESQTDMYSEYVCVRVLGYI
ncbi:hypothetical protein LSH36_13g00002, partial [Paralvinella palmiformis]